jgi:hypothetical protein
MILPGTKYTFRFCPRIITISTASPLSTQFSGEIIILIGSQCNSPKREGTREKTEEGARGLGPAHFNMDPETGKAVEDGFNRVVREGIQKIPDFFDPPDTTKPPNRKRQVRPELMETAKREGKGFCSLFGSKNADCETAPNPRPLASISIQTPPAAPVFPPAVDADRQKVVEEARDSKAQELLDRIDDQFLLFEHQLDLPLSERENSNKNLEEQLTP